MSDSREMPWSAEAEVSVLGGMLIDGEAVAPMVETLEPEMFYREGNATVFRAMTRIHRRGGVIDVTTLSNELKSAGELEQAGGMPRIANLVDAVPTGANAEYHARIIRDKYALRRLIRTAGEVQQEAHEASQGEVRETMDRAERRVLEVARQMDRGEYSRPTSLVMEAMDEIGDEIDAGPDVVSGLPTGFRDLDHKTSGLHTGELAILGGRPSMGKTSMALNIASHLTCGESVPVGIFSLEMSETALVKRMICSEARLPYHKIRRGNLDDGDYERLAQAAGLVKQAPLMIDDTADLTVLQARSRARRMVERDGARLIIVDYLQYMPGPSGKENRQQEVAHISRGLKAMAKELDVAVLALSQLSRKPESRDKGRPRMADLRNSGAIEQDADLIMFVYRPEQYMDATSERYAEARGEATIIVAKQRNGPTGDVEMVFRDEIMRFEGKSRRERAA